MSEDFADISRADLNFHLSRYNGCLYIDNDIYPINISIRFNSLYIVYYGSRLYLNIID